MIAENKQSWDLKPGDKLPFTEKILSSHNLMMYGAATWDWHRLHYDAAFAEEMGLPGPVMDGQIFGALFAKQVIDWLGPKAFIINLDLRMRSMAFAGDTVFMEGNVTEINTETSSATIILNQVLQKRSHLVAEATTAVRLPE